MKRRLADIAQVRPGYLFRGRVKPDPRGPVRVVQIKDIDADRQIRVAGLDRVTIDKPELYRVERGDVLFLSRGHRLYATVVPDVDVNTIATGYFFILRPRGGVLLPDFLAWSLNQPDFQESLKPIHRGSHMPMVARADLESLKIHVPRLAVQERVLHLNELLQRERHLATAIQEKRALLVQAASNRLIRENPTDKDN